MTRPTHDSYPRDNNNVFQLFQNGNNQTINQSKLKTKYVRREKLQLFIFFNVRFAVYLFVSHIFVSVLFSICSFVSQSLGVPHTLAESPEGLQQEFPGSVCAVGLATAVCLSRCKEDGLCFWVRGGRKREGSEFIYNDCYLCRNWSSFLLIYCLQNNL